MNYSPQGSVRVMVVDDHELLRQGVIATLSEFDGMEVVGEAADGPSAVALASELHPDVVVMDLMMPGGGGVLAISEITDRWPDISVLAFSSFSERELVHSALQAGAASYITKNVDRATLVNAVQSTAQGQSTLSPDVIRHFTDNRNAGSPTPPQALQNLTNRELEVVDLVAAGRSNAEIATELALSLFTVKNHVRNILMKLRVRTRSEAAALVHRSGN